MVRCWVELRRKLYIFRLLTGEIPQELHKTKVRLSMSVAPSNTKTLRDAICSTANIYRNCVKSLSWRNCSNTTDMSFTVSFDELVESDRLWPSCSSADFIHNLCSICFWNFNDRTLCVTGQSLGFESIGWNKFITAILSFCFHRAISFYWLESHFVYTNIARVCVYIIR